MLLKEEFHVADIERMPRMYATCHHAPRSLRPSLHPSSQWVYNVHIKLAHKIHVNPFNLVHFNVELLACNLVRFTLPYF